MKRKTDTDENKKFWSMVDKAALEVAYWPERMKASYALEDALGAKPCGKRKHINDKELENWFWDRIQLSEYSEILKVLEKLKNEN